VSSSSARTNPPDDSADELAPCEHPCALPIDDFAGIVDGYDAPRAYDAQVEMGCDFCEHSAKRMA
jgi:hypothetical protein